MTDPLKSVRVRLEHDLIEIQQKVYAGWYEMLDRIAEECKQPPTQSWPHHGPLQLDE